MRLGYPGLSHYSSTVGSESVLFPLRRLGVEQRHYRTRFTRGTPLAAASLFGIRAIVDIDLSVVANPTALPLAFSAPTSVIRSVSYEHVPYGNLNRVYPVLSGEDFGPIYEPVEAIAVTETEGTVWTLPPGMKHPVYMFAFGNDTLPNRIDGSSDTEEVTFLTDESIFLGLEKPGETIRVTSLLDGGINGTNEAADRVFYSESIDILSRYAAVIQPRGVPVEKIGSSQLRARFTCAYRLFLIIAKRV